MSTDQARPDVPTVTLTIDGQTVDALMNRPLIEVAREAGRYVPGWCHHPGMRPMSHLDAADVVYRPVDAPTTSPPRGVEGVAAEAVPEVGEPIHGRDGAIEGCGMCAVEVDGELALSCETRAAAGQEVRTDTPAVRDHQRDVMADRFRYHPHACLDCPQKEGCDRITCSMGVPEEARCCGLIGNCELEKSAEAIDLDWSDVPAYEPLERPVQRTPVFDINWELCIGCNRCVGVCEDHVGAGVWSFTIGGDDPQGRHTEVVVGLKAEELAKSGCKYCTACVDACPTGTLMNNDGGDRDRLPLEFRQSMPEVVFPDETIAMSEEAIQREVPNAGGVYTLYDDDGSVVEISGVADVRAGLLKEVDRTDAVKAEIDLDANFTQRETELIEQYVNEHGHMPGMGGDAMDDLF